MPTKKEIKTAIITEYWDDLEFIEEINNLTWARKVHLKEQSKQK